ncbi:unnamed protein product [Effrenium voratum]|nr:unnamed protein product [Effrenium voratum]
MPVPWLEDLDLEQRLEAVKQAQLMRVPQGGEITKTGEPSIFVLLKGAVGRYSEGPKVSEEVNSAVSEEHDQHQEEMSWKQMRLEKCLRELAELELRHRRPLDCSLQDSLRLHALRRQVAKLTEDVAQEPPPPPPPRSVESRRESPDPEAMPASGTFLTAPGEEADTHSGKLEDFLDTALEEYFEGDVFESGCKFLAHQEAALLVFPSDGRLALERCEELRRQRRGQVLRDCLKDEEAAQRLLPLFREETRRKGAVLVKAGISCNSLWLITEGSCKQFAKAKRGEAEAPESEAFKGNHKLNQWFGI